MDIVTKDFPVTAGDATDEHPHGTFEVILSAPTQDRDGEVVDSKAFEPLPDHITFDTDHSMTCDSVVGSGVPSYAEDGTLRVKGSYAQDERSQIIRQKVLDGHIRTTSVTFMAATRAKDAKGVEHVTKAELINGTFTPVPSNRESVVLASKSILAHDLAEKVGARNSASDATTIQSMHDATVGLGAACSGAKSFTTKENAPNDDDTTDPATLVLALDASIDEAVALLDGIDLESLPAEVQQAVALIQAASVAADELLGALGVPDPDSDTNPADEAASSSAAQAAESDTAKSADEGSVKSAELARLEADVTARLLSGF